VAGVILIREFGTLSPRRVLAAARARFVLPLPLPLVGAGVAVGPAVSADQNRGPDRDQVEQRDHVGDAHADAPV
jgi:hypothetical protein